ncbi:hypothetical protein BN2475_90101 [Paraburkholderia ribeironis]|uniref:Uncharacterized protein n=1 Tax=Paraburkholderia ribeironis TaxID=1247936 RepID=A0A1N7RNA7_9BURK|nr:hypothetical protein BN2475_90101 [Paraburkholderia ribeironis]
MALTYMRGGRDNCTHTECSGTHGYSRETRDGRVSTEIVQLDVAARIGRTASGRVYCPILLSGWSSDSKYVFNRVADIVGDGDPWHDVTAELIPNCRLQGRTTPKSFRSKWLLQCFSFRVLMCGGSSTIGLLPARIDKYGSHDALRSRLVTLSF